MRGPRSRARFPGFDVLEQSGHWDPVTREVVMARLRINGRPAFFTPAEERVCRALCATLLALEGSASEPPVFEMIAGRLAAGITDGWHYDDMPPDAEAWRSSLRELEASRFTELGAGGRDAVVDGVKSAASFAGMPGRRLFDLWMRYACTAYYAHPAAWSEIGFGGPAYPRGYKNLGLGRREPWEVRERGAEDPVPVAARAERRREDRERRRAV